MASNLDGERRLAQTGINPVFARVSSIFWALTSFPCSERFSAAKGARKCLSPVNQLTPEEQWQVMGHLMNQLQHRAIVIAKPDRSLSDSTEEQWDEQIANDLETGKLNQLIAKAEADIKANQVRDLNEVLRNP